MQSISTNLREKGLRYEIVEFVRNIQDEQFDNLLLTKADMLAEAKSHGNERIRCPYFKILIEGSGL